MGTAMAPKLGELSFILRKSFSSKCGQILNGKIGRGKPSCSYRDIIDNSYREYSSEASDYKQTSNGELPTSADVVVIGGGIVGTSTAFHLAKRGVDVILVERHK